MLPPTGSRDGRGLREAKADIGSSGLVDCSLGLGGGVGWGRGDTGQIWREHVEAARGLWRGMGQLLPSALPGWFPPFPPTWVNPPLPGRNGHGGGSGGGPLRRSCQGCCTQSRQPPAGAKASTAATASPSPDNLHFSSAGLPPPWIARETCRRQLPLAPSPSSPLVPGTGVLSPVVLCLVTWGH